MSSTNMSSVPQCIPHSGYLKKHFINLLPNKTNLHLKNSFYCNFLVCEFFMDFILNMLLYLKSKIVGLSS